MNNPNAPEYEMPDSIEFGVDLSEQEFVDYQLLLAQSGGALRYRKGQVVLSAAMVLICIGYLIYSFIKTNQLDVMTLLLTILMVAFSLLPMFVVPNRIRKNAAKQYQERFLSGGSYEGIVRVYLDHIEKETSDGVTSVAFAEGVYVEQQAMMLVMSPEKKAIILPARFLTQPDADYIRRAVMKGMPLQRQQVVSQLICLANERATVVLSQKEEEEVLQTISFQYTQEEFVSSITTLSLRTFVKMMPVYSAVSLMTGILFSVLDSFLVGAVAFVVSMLLLFLFNVVLNRSRAARTAQQVPDSFLSALIKFTRRGVAVVSNNQEILLPWQSMKRAVEQPDFVEFSSDTNNIRIPKRCIEDMETLRKIVDTYHPSPKKS